MSKDLHSEMLQFLDDAVILGEGSWENLCSIKAVLCEFELVSGLRVNSFHNKIIHINLKEDFVYAATPFLSCGIGSITFNFLGILAGINPRSISFWAPILKMLCNRLTSWKARQFSIGDE